MLGGLRRRRRRGHWPRFPTVRTTTDELYNKCEAQSVSERARVCVCAKYGSPLASLRVAAFRATRAL